MADKTCSITTPIYYVNSKPHLGTAYTTVAADTIARYGRMNGLDVSFVTGMDEHGQKVAQTAKEHGMDPQAWCDSIEPAFRKVWDLLDIKYTDFVRTTENRHTRSVQKFWQDLYDKGYLYKSSYEGWYCVHEETYHAESDLQKVEDGTYLCPECERPVQQEEGEENWFFKMSDFRDRLLKHYYEHPDFIRPEIRRNEVISFVKSGLKDLSISRSTFSWGIPLPFDEKQVAYVWADALITYLTGIGYADPEREAEFAAHWPNEYHFVGKDIIRFHCVIWPAMLMAAEMPLPKCVFGHGFLLTKGAKMSKSKGNSVMPEDLTAIYGVDAYRYYFITDFDFGADGSISIERMTQVYNADLANTWGNLCSRSLNMIKKYYDSKVPEADVSIDNPLKEIAEGLYEEYDKAMKVVDFATAAKAALKLAEMANLYIEEMAPWTLAKEGKDAELAEVMYSLAESIRIVALYMYPFMPETSSKVFERLSLGKVEEIEDIKAFSQWGLLPVGNTVEAGDALFPRLDVEQIDLSID
ncbi:MAG: methionine--tRNA ligase [Eggerthellaceae bacterium]|nr:methionine--tRNA ligase [Eggerthellaceae bacterium]